VRPREAEEETGIAGKNNKNWVLTLLRLAPTCPCSTCANDTQVTQWIRLYPNGQHLCTLARSNQLEAGASPLQEHLHRRQGRAGKRSLQKGREGNAVLAGYPLTLPPRNILNLFISPVRKGRGSGSGFHL
jgi:hypothetical protein